ncbi:MAG: MerR family transcriptional regulator [Oscillibacter sp.]|nr:MerR family transcriptional regulator [Oscillibacter sp.]
MEKLLKISEFAALSGISRQLLIYYDNQGILHPKQVDRENGYRYYSYHQLTAASVIVSLRQAGMSLEYIRTYLMERSPEKLMVAFREQENNLTEQIQKLERIRGMVQSRLEHTEQGICIGEEQIWTADCPEENIFLGPALPKGYEPSDSWDCLPAFYEACISQNIQIGLTVGSLVEYDKRTEKLLDRPTRYFCRLPEQQYPVFHIKPAGRYVMGTQFTDYGFTDALYQRIFRYADAHGLKICGDAYEEFLIDEIAERDVNRYMLQISVQIE